VRVFRRGATRSARARTPGAERLRAVLQAHRPPHIAEMEQELGQTVHFSATSIEMVRGILVTAHLFVKEESRKKDIWKTYREVYGKEPFIRIVKEKQGIYRFPEPKIVAGTIFVTLALSLKRRDSSWSPPSTT